MLFVDDVYTSVAITVGQLGLVPVKIRKKIQVYLITTKVNTSDQKTTNQNWILGGEKKLFVDSW